MQNVLNIHKCHPLIHKNETSEAFKEYVIYFYIKMNRNKCRNLPPVSIIKWRMSHCDLLMYAETINNNINLHIIHIKTDR